MRAVTGASFYAPVEPELRELERRLLEVGRGAHPVFRDAVAHAQGLEPSLIAPRAAIDAVVAGESETDALLVPWQRDLLEL